MSEGRTGPSYREASLLIKMTIKTNECYSNYLANFPGSKVDSVEDRIIFCGHREKSYQEQPFSN